MEKTRRRSQEKARRKRQRIGAPDSAKACYIYGIAETNRKQTLKVSPIRGGMTRVYTIPYHDIAALVSRTDFEEYDPTEENLLAHNEVVQNAMHEFGCTVIPLRFSTIARSEDDVIRILSSGYSDFKKKLSSLKGKVEIVIKVFCDVQGLRREMTEGHRLADALDIDEKIAQRTYWLASTLLERLKGVSEQSQLNDIFFEDMIMNGAFLVSQGNVQKFFDEIKSFDSEHGKHLRIQCSGPYAPYSFADLPKNQVP